VGEVSLFSSRSQWLKNTTQRVVALAYVIASVLSFAAFLIGFLFASFVSIYLAILRLVYSIALFGLALPFLNHQHRMIRLLYLTITLSGFLAVVSSVWFILETFYLGLPILFPNSSVYLDAITNILLLLGLFAISGERRLRETTQILGYVIMAFLFIASIILIYVTNLQLNPPIFPAVGAGARLLLSFLILVFAWGFLFTKEPTYSSYGWLSRLQLVVAGILLMLSRILFALQYATGFNQISLFYYAGSLSDVITVFGEFTFFIAILGFFAETNENTTQSRSISLRYVAGLTIFSLMSFILLTFITATIAVVLVGRLIPVFLPPLEAMIATQTIGYGLIIAVGVILSIGGVVATFLINLIGQPLEKMDAQVAAVTEPGTISYEEPSQLIFTELHSLSDNFRTLIDEIKRVRTEFRRKIGTLQIDAPSTTISEQMAKLYCGILEREIANQLQIILANAEKLIIDEGTSATTKQYATYIVNTITDLQDTLQVIQQIQHIDDHGSPDLHRVNLYSLLTKVTQEMEEQLSSLSAQITINKPEKLPDVFANHHLKDVLTLLLKFVINRDTREKPVIVVKLSQILELSKTYWQIDIIAQGWIVSDAEKVQIFDSSSQEPQIIDPKLLLVTKLIESFKGRIRLENRVLDDPQFGTIISIILPAFLQKSPSSEQKIKKTD
jgi:hypothetical protein